MRKWHKGNPPCVGWYNASAIRKPKIWRWWDGQAWSEVAFDSDSATEAADSSKNLVPAHFLIEWTTYWPENARVPDTRNLKGYK
jgi:hypothetical protein